MLGHRHEPAAVVAQVEHELVGPGVAQLREGGVEGGDRGLHEVAEVQVADAASRRCRSCAVCETVGIVTIAFTSRALFSRRPAGFAR